MKGLGVFTASRVALRSASIERRRRLHTEHGADLDEDLSVEGILAGRLSAEGQASLKKWLTNRRGLANKRMQPARANARAQDVRRRARG
jgi:hypothetical protein